VSVLDGHEQRFPLGQIRRQPVEPVQHAYGRGVETLVEHDALRQPRRAGEQAIATRVAAQHWLQALTHGAHRVFTLNRRPTGVEDGHPTTGGALANAGQ
jgi:hypothetical protein